MTPRMLGGSISGGSEGPGKEDGMKKHAIRRPDEWTGGNRHGISRRRFLGRAALAAGAAALPWGIRRAGAAEAPALQAATSDAERTRISRLIEGAKREGSLAWYGPMIEPPQGAKLLEAYKKYYGLADLKTEYTYAAPGETITKVEEFMRAGRAYVDVVWNAAYAWYKDLRARGEFLAYTSPGYETYTIARAQHMADPQFFVSDAYAFHPMYNPQALAKHGLGDWKPTSWKDLTDPRLKGLVSIGDVMQSTSHAETMQGLLKVFGREYFEALAKNVHPVTMTRSAQGRDWVASGEYPITFSSHAKNTLTLRKRGVDVKLLYPKEGIVLLPYTLGILKRAPHPNAAKLFVDFARSKQGLETVLNAGGLIFPGRTGVQSPVPDLQPPIEQVTLIPMDWEKEGTRDAITQVRALWRELGLSR